MDQLLSRDLSWELHPLRKKKLVRGPPVNFFCQTYEKGFYEWLRCVCHCVCDDITVLNFWSILSYILVFHLFRDSAGNLKAKRYLESLPQKSGGINVGGGRGGYVTVRILYFQKWSLMRPLFVERVFTENTTGYLSTVPTGSKEALWLYWLMECADQNQVLALQVALRGGLTLSLSLSRCSFSVSLPLWPIFNIVIPSTTLSRQTQTSHQLSCAHIFTNPFWNSL